MEVLEKLMTYQEFREIEFDEDDDFRYELLNGILVRKGSPTIQHQRIAGNVYFNMRLLVEEKSLGEVFSAPLDVVLDEHNAPQPDVFFVSKDRSFILDEKEQVVIGTPDIVVEILSPGSVKKDRIEKKEIYERSGIREFWIVDPSYRNVEIYRLAEGHYELFDFIEETGVVKSSVLEGFEMELSKIF
ncbi:MAG: Uma2 family endonuclease [Saprospiraceae bacterium]|nr:MAG: Uma2 family endonuclease [Saprospiraceae bacterium]